MDVTRVTRSASKPKVRICKFEFEKWPKDLISRHPAKAVCRTCSRVCCSHGRLKQISQLILPRNSARIFIIHCINYAWRNLGFVGYM